MTTFRLTRREPVQEVLIDHQQDAASPMPQMPPSAEQEPPFAAEEANQVESNVPLAAPVPEDHGESLSVDNDADHDSSSFFTLNQVTVPPRFDRSQFAAAVVYPEVAKRRGIEGRVLLRLFIDAQGMLQDIVVEEDPGYGFAESAVRSFAKVRFEPALIDGKAVAVTLQYPVLFTLGR